MGISIFVEKWTKPGTGSVLGICAVCGYTGSDLLSVGKVLDPSTGKINELFSHNSNEICAYCSALWSKPKVWHRSIFVTGDRLAFPLIATEGTIKKSVSSAAMQRDPMQDWSDRPTWRELVRDRTWWHQERYAVLTTDGQRRIWHKARASKGENLAVVFHALERGLSALAVINLPLVCDCLDAIERVYANGFSKDAIATSLFGSGDLRKALHYEPTIKPLRGSSEFLFALTIAQKDEDLIDATDPQPSVSTGRFKPLEEARVTGSTVSEAEPGATGKTGRKGDRSNQRLSIFG